MIIILICFKKKKKKKTVLFVWIVINEVVNLHATSWKITAGDLCFRYVFHDAFCQAKTMKLHT